MSNKLQYKGIDERQIKCECESDNCKQAGISFEDNILRFHFLEMIGYGFGKQILHQNTVHLHLNKASRDELVKELKAIKFKK